ncbi:MAG TPA: S28 family serine protease [Tenuifilaceae bacterium]|nr:S28 family serine protease [Tenuifilaceae bacterium]HRX67906.1 S28 family serine protease [Tenuifilaceae bacterium]
MKTWRKISFRIIALVIIAILFASCQKDNDDFDSLDILKKLNSLEGVSAVEIDPQNEYCRSFQVDITQPVDHNNPSGPKFTQRAYLHHVDDDMPIVFAPNGYRSTPTSRQEISTLLQTNLLHVTHRFFYDSRPASLDWQYLTVKQAADDHHNIVTLFKKIYEGKWISSGGSKSGLACLFHKRYYPEDVDATIAYVAPFTFGPNDTRFVEYLQNVGSNECYPKLVGIQQFVLKHRSEMLEVMDQYINTHPNETYTMDRDQLLEITIMDFPFTFWQYYNFSCSSIPDTTGANPADIYSYYTSIVPQSSFSDETLAYYEPYVYQAMTEVGAPAYDFQALEGLLTKIDPNSCDNPNFQLLAPAGADYTFNYTTIPEIYSWLQNYGDHIIYIYGENDPWSAGAIELTGSADALFFMQPGTNHGVKIVNLDNPDVVYQKLEEWLGIEISSAQKSQPVNIEPEEVRFKL